MGQVRTRDFWNVLYHSRTLLEAVALVGFSYQFVFAIRDICRIV